MSNVEPPMGGESGEPAIPGSRGGGLSPVNLGWEPGSAGSRMNQRGSSPNWSWGKQSANPFDINYIKSLQKEWQKLYDTIRKSADLFKGARVGGGGGTGGWGGSGTPVGGHQPAPGGPLGLPAGPEQKSLGPSGLRVASDALGVVSGVAQRFSQAKVGSAIQPGPAMLSQSLATQMGVSQTSGIRAMFNSKYNFGYTSAAENVGVQQFLYQNTGFGNGMSPESNALRQQVSTLALMQPGIGAAGAARFVASAQSGSMSARARSLGVQGFVGPGGVARDTFATLNEWANTLSGTGGQRLANGQQTFSPNQIIDARRGSGFLYNDLNRLFAGNQDAINTALDYYDKNSSFAAANGGKLVDTSNKKAVQKAFPTALTAKLDKIASQSQLESSTYQGLDAASAAADKLAASLTNLTNKIASPGLGGAIGGIAGGLGAMGGGLASGMALGSLLRMGGRGAAAAGGAEGAAEGSAAGGAAGGIGVGEAGALPVLGGAIGTGAMAAPLIGGVWAAHRGLNFFGNYGKSHKKSLLGQASKYEGYALTPWSAPMNAGFKALGGIKRFVFGGGSNVPGSGVNQGSTGGGSGGTANGLSIVADARKYIGIPYKWGGTNPSSGLDCSGLVQRVYADFGISLPRTSGDQAKAGTAVSDISQAQAGDILAFGAPVHHVGIYIGNGRMIEAPHTGSSVRESNAGRADLTAIRRIGGVAGGTGVSPGGSSTSGNTTGTMGTPSSGNKLVSGFGEGGASESSIINSMYGSPSFGFSGAPSSSVNGQGTDSGNTNSGAGPNVQLSGGPPMPGSAFTQQSWAQDLLSRLGGSKLTTASNIQDIVNWENLEGGHFHNTRKFNPLNTSQKMPGSQSGGKQGNIQSYPDYETGMQATLKTLNNGRYNSILAGLARGNETWADFLGTLKGTPWDAGHYSGASAGKAAGAWDVEQDQVTKVHRGEMILPASEAAIIRQSNGKPGAAGGNVIHLHIAQGAIVVQAQPGQDTNAIGNAVATSITDRSNYELLRIE